MEGISGPDQWWEQQARPPHEARCIDRPRVRLLLSEGHSCYRTRTGERKCKSWLWGVWGVILGGMREDIPGLTDTTLLLE